MKPYGDYAHLFKSLCLVMKAHGLDFVSALRKLAEENSIPFEDPRLTPDQRRDHDRRRRMAEPEARRLAQAALSWLQGRMAEVSDRKAQAVAEDGIDIGALACYARELYRLERLTPDGVVREYLRYHGEHPCECAALVHVGRVWQQSCEAVVGAVIRKIQEARNAA